MNQKVLNEIKTRLINIISLTFTTIETLLLNLSLKRKSFTARCCFSIPPENTRKPLGFLMFSGGIEK